MSTFFYNRRKDTGEPATQRGRSAAPHLYLSAKKAAMRVNTDHFDQVEVMLVEAGKPPVLTKAQLDLALKQAARLGEDVTEDGDMVPVYSFSTVELQMLFTSVLTIAHGNGDATSKN